MCRPTSIDLDSKLEQPVSTASVTAAVAAGVSDAEHILCAQEALCDGQAHSAASQCTKASCAAEANSCSAKILSWQADAQQYDMVEEWFHALVRAHFKGSLKVCSMGIDIHVVGCIQC